MSHRDDMSFRIVEKKHGYHIDDSASTRSHLSGRCCWEGGWWGVLLVTGACEMCMHCGGVALREVGNR